MDREVIEQKLESLRRCLHRVAERCPPTLTVKKIPKAVPARCELGKVDYSLQVDNLPQAPLPLGQHALESDVVEAQPAR